VEKFFLDSQEKKSVSVTEKVSPIVHSMNPEQYRLNPDRSYAFKSTWKTALVKIFDLLGSLVFRSLQVPIDWKSVKKVAVLRLDQLGDVILALPVLEVLAEALPNAQVDFVVEPAAKALVEMTHSRIHTRFFNAPWLSKSKPRFFPFKAVADLTAFIKEGGYDAVIDLRGDLHHILAMKRAKVPLRIGRPLTGGGFWLTHPVIRQPGLHEIEQNLDLLKKVGINIPEDKKYTQLFPRDDGQLQTAQQRLLGLTSPVVAIHATCAASAKRWPVTYWQKFIKKLPQNLDVVILGTESEKTDIEAITKGCERKVIVAAGVFQLPELASFLKECKLFVGVDSGPAHIAAAVGTPVVSIFSGTNNAAQWAPRGPRVSLIQKHTPCSPCERAECPLNNECMRQIEVEEVWGLAKAYL
jgi:ADP-heptose:LPS heptosyltransferase